MIRLSSCSLEKVLCRGGHKVELADIVDLLIRIVGKILNVLPRTLSKELGHTFGLLRGTHPYQTVIHL